MKKKLESRKFWVSMAILFIFNAYFLANWIEVTPLIEIIKWTLGLYFSANVVEAFKKEIGTTVQAMSSSSVIDGDKNRNN